MKRLPKNILTELSAITGISAKILSAYVNAKTDKDPRPGRKRARVLEQGCAQMGMNIPANLWLYSEHGELKAAFFKYYEPQAA